ncbi:MAG: sulfotransferase [Verrucomicrobia bacterium]|nr:sulfotransferase [Verrucomicrobiota bacterium]
MSETLPKKLFLCGHRKCGTTMFSNLFDGHPELMVYPTDISVLYGYFPYYLEAHPDPQERRNRLECVVFQTLSRLIDKFGLRQELPLDAFRSHFFSSIRDEELGRIPALIDRLESSFRAAVPGLPERPKWSVIKETSIEIYAHHLFAWYPDCKVVQLIRDPRDNYASIKSGHEKHYQVFGESQKHGLASLLHRGRLGMQLASLHQRRFGNHRYAVLRFEDLVTKPSEVMEGICRFLGIVFDDCLKVPTILGKPTHGNNFDGEKFYELTARNVGRWRERITDEEAMIIEFHFRELLTAFGYEPAFEETQAADAACEFYKWVNYSYFYRDSFPAMQRRNA